MQTELNICTKAVRGRIVKSLSDRNLKERDNTFVADCAAVGHDPEQSLCREGGDAVDVSESKGLALHCSTYTLSPWGSEDIFHFFQVFYFMKK